MHLLSLPLLFLAGSASADDAALRAAVQALRPALLETRRDLHRHPELGNREQRTGKLVAERLRALGLEVRYPVAKTGVVAVLRGGRPGVTLALRADLDALPIEERNEVAYKSTVPGVKHACGHDAHTTIVLGVAEVLQRFQGRLPGTLVFVFQPAEEGAPAGERGGAELMIAEGLLDEWRPAAMYGLHMDPTLEVGSLGYSIGPIFASSDTFTIEVQGKKTHGAYPHTGLDPIPVAAQIVTALQALVARELDAQKPKVRTIGQIHGGNRFNIIADAVSMQGTLRTLDPELRRSLPARLRRVVEHTAAAFGTTAKLTFADEGNPPTVNDAALTRAALPSLERVYGPGRVLLVAPQMGAEDFAQFAERVPSLYVKMGVRNAARGITAMIHTEDFDIDEDVLPLGVRAMSTLLWDELLRRQRP